MKLHYLNTGMVLLRYRCKKDDLKNVIDKKKMNLKHG